MLITICYLPIAYTAFIAKLFREHTIKITGTDIDKILEWADGNTYNVQLLCNRVFSKTTKVVTISMIDEAIIEIYAEAKLSYFALRSSMSKTQWQVLTAIALEEMVYTPTSKEFIRKHHLGSGPTVLRALEYLVKRELVYKYISKEERNYYQVYDIILMRWIQKK